MCSQAQLALYVHMPYPKSNQRQYLLLGVFVAAGRLDPAGALHVVAALAFGRLLGCGGCLAGGGVSGRCPYLDVAACISGIAMASLPGRASSLG